MSAAAGARERLAHHDSYADGLIRAILRRVRTIAMVGASARWNRPSYFAMKYLQEKGYRVIPVNPREAGGSILGETAYADLAEIPDPVDMVQVFRRADAMMPIAEQAVAIGAKVLWMQLGVRNDEAAALAERAGLRVVMNRCPKIEYGRLSGEIGWLGVNTRVVSSRRNRRI
ncbi:MAG: CoA-binding protein [Alphaproteobacteria bacterium]|nr:CoA-binding protein [Alphaproteobacteria bacterium]